MNLIFFTTFLYLFCFIQYEIEGRKISKNLEKPSLKIEKKPSSKSKKKPSTKSEKKHSTKSKKKASHKSEKKPPSKSEKKHSNKKTKKTTTKSTKKTTPKSTKKPSSKDEKLPYFTNNKKIMYYCRSKYIEDYIDYEFKNIQKDTCLTFKKQNNLLTSTGINFFDSKNEDMLVIPKNKKKPINIYLRNQTYNGRILRFYIGYVLGLIPEAARKDRGNDVIIYQKNIAAKYTKYFEKVKNYPKSYYETDFDFTSVMLPNPFFGSKKDGLRTYFPRFSPLYEMTAEEYAGFVFNDYKRLNILYCKNECKKSKKCKNSGYYKDDCSGCHCPFFFEGKWCQKLEPSDIACGSKQDYFSHSKKTFKTFKNLSGKCLFRINSSNSKKKVRLIIESFKKVDIYSGVSIKYRKDKGVNGLNIYKNVKNLQFPPLSRSVLIYFILNNPEDELRISYQTV